MAKKKPDYTEQQIVAYLLSGGSVDDLYKNTKINTNQILSAIVNNPKLFTSLKTEAETQAYGLDRFNENENYIPPEDYVEPVNKYTEQYAMMNPKAYQLATDYMNGVAAIGNNPSKLAEHSENMRKAAEQGGMDPVEAGQLIYKFGKEADDWFAEELNIKRQKREENFKAFQAGRKNLDLKTGDNPTIVAMSKLTGGYGKLADVISPDVTWEQIALEEAGKKLVKTKGKAPKGGFTNVRQAETALDTTKNTKQMTQEMKDFMQGYLNVVAEKLPKGQTPYTTSVKKLIPYLQSNNPFGK
jgi:hypothetical protein